jgi:UPF0042 nucleotide-binding protein
MGARFVKDSLQDVVLVTGPSGAGRSTAINALEDLGYEAIDNLPLSLLPRLFEGPPMAQPLAIGVDARTRDFSAGALQEAVDTLERNPDVSTCLLYVDANAETLIRRFSETRRRHPMAPEEAPLLGIEREQDLLQPIRSRADILIDTSEQTPHDLRGEINRWFSKEEATGLVVTLHSFSYKRGVPRGADMVLDCRFLRNPYWEPRLRSLDGRDKAVADYVMADEKYPAFFSKLTDLTEFLLPAYRDEGKSYFSVALGCTGGQHRSVTVAEALANRLAQKSWQVSIRHREVERVAPEGDSKG